MACFVFITQTPPLDKFSLSEGHVAALFLIGVLVFITLQVTNVRYPKPTKRMALFIPSVILVLLFVLLGARAAMHVAIALLALGVLYIVLGPLFVRTVSHHKTRRDALRDDTQA